MKNGRWILAVTVLFAAAAGAADQAKDPGAALPAGHAHQAQVQEATTPAPATTTPGGDDDCDAANCTSNQVGEAQRLAIKQKGLPGKSSSKKENEALQNRK